MAKKFWLNTVKDMGIEVLEVYPDRDRNNLNVFLTKGKASVRVNRLGIEIRGIAYAKESRGKNKGTRWFVKDFGLMKKRKNGSELFVQTLTFFDEDYEIWEAINKLILKTIREESLPYVNQERIFPFSKLPDRIVPPPPGEVCPSGKPWTEILEQYKIELINIYSKTGGVPEAGTKEQGSCHVFFPTFGIEIKNIGYKTSHNWTKDFIIKWPRARFANLEGKEEITPKITFMEQSRLIWRATAKVISKEVGKMR